MENCVCDGSCRNIQSFCTSLKETLVRIAMMLSTIVYSWMSYIILSRMRRECTREWTRYDYELFLILYITFSLLYVFVFEAVVKPFHCIRYFMVRLYRCMRFCMRYIWNRARLPTRSDFHRIFPMKRAINRNQIQPEITNSANELNDDRPPPLPPRNRVVTEPRTSMFQKLTSKMFAGVKSRTTVEDESPDPSSSHLQRPHCSKQSAEPSRRRGKKLTKRSQFKNMMSKVTNLQAINEEDLEPQGASGIKVSLSILTENSSSDSETEKETSFTVESYQYKGAGQDLDFKNTESGEQAPTQRVYGIESQLKPSNIRDEQSDPDETSESPEQPSTSGYVPVLKIGNPTSSPRKLALTNAPISKFGTVTEMIQSPLSSFENLTQDDLCSSQGEQMASGMQDQSLERLPELGSQSRPFDLDGIENQTIHQPFVSACPQVSQPQTQSSTVSPSGSQEHSQMTHIQKAQGKGDQAGPRYVKLPEQLAFSDIRIENKPSSTEQSALRDVSIPLQSQVSAMPGVQKMPSYQGQTSSAGVSDLQKHGRISDVQKRRLSRKHSPIPCYRKYSDSERQSPEETLNLQPIQSRTKFYSAENQLQASGIGDVHESSLQERGLQEKSLQEASTPKTSRTSNILEKLRNLHQASAAGFPVAASEIRHVVKDPVLPLFSDYAGEKFRGKAERAIYLKRRGSLSLVSERPVRESNTRKKKTGFVAGNTSGLSDSASGDQKTSSMKGQQILSSGYTPHSVLPWSGGTPTQAHGATTHKTKDEDQISQQSQRNRLHLHEKYKVAAEKKTFLSLALATGGLVLSTDGAEEDETGVDSSEQSYMYDQPMNILDVTHIDVPLPPKNINPSKDETQNSAIPTCPSSSRTKTAEESIESPPRLSTCAREGIKTISGEMQQIEESQGSYTLQALPSTSTQPQVVTTPPKESESRIGKQSSSNPLPPKEKDNEETQRTSYTTRKLATGGLLLSKDEAENNETKAESSETLFTHDQPISTSDLTHSKLPLLPKYKGKGESQISKETVYELSTRTCITKQSVESTSRLSACASGGVESSSTQKQQIEASEEGYATHSTLPTSGGTSTPTHVLSTPLKRKEVEYRIGQLTSKDSSLLKETEMLEAEKKETFLTLDQVTGGIVMSNETEDGTEADSSKTSFMYDQPIGVLDLTHIEVPSPPPKDKKASKGKKKHQD